MTKEELQDEISAIDAIYPGCTTEVAPQIYNFKVLQHQGLELQLSFPQTYPDEAPSIIQVIVDDPVKFSDAGYLEKSFGSKLKEIFRSGEVCMFEFLSELDVMLESYSDRENSLEEKVKDLVIESRDTSPKDFIDRKEPKEQDVKAVDPLAGWIQSDPVVDRGSTFIGFTREVHSLDEAEHDLDILVADKKVSKAAHNISAWRIKGNGGVQYQDCDDDGETAAGGRLLHLLTMMDVWNVVVVVSRWFGGTLLGSDRFKHINTAGRNAIVKAGFIEDNKSNNNNTGKELGKKKKKAH